MVVCVVAMMATACGTKEYSRENLREDKYYICFNEVNIREKPDSNSTIVDKMYLGYSIELSGKVVEYPGHEVYALWYETSDGYWVVADAVMDEFNFEWKFGY